MAHQLMILINSRSKSQRMNVTRCGSVNRHIVQVINGFIFNIL